MTCCLLLLLLLLPSCPEAVPLPHWLTAWHTQRSSRQHHRSLLQDAATAVNASAAANTSSTADEPAAAATADPTQRDSWEGVEPSYAAHYKSDDERPNMCKVAHRVPAPLGKQPYNFTEGQKDYIPYIGMYGASTCTQARNTSCSTRGGPAASPSDFIRLVAVLLLSSYRCGMCGPCGCGTDTHSLHFKCTARCHTHTHTPRHQCRARQSVDADEALLQVRALVGSSQQRQLQDCCSLAAAALQQALSIILEVLAAAAVAVAVLPW